jgi:hypothetical protein
LIVATLLVIPVMILQVSDVPDAWTLVGYIGDCMIWLTFLAEGRADAARCTGPPPVDSRAPARLS